MIPSRTDLPDEADDASPHPADDSDSDPSGDDDSYHSSDFDSDSDSDSDFAPDSDLAPDPGSNTTPEAFPTSLARIEHMPLDDAHVSNILSANGTLQFNVVPRRRGYVPGTPFIAIQNRDEAAREPFIMVGLMPWATLREMIDWCFGPPPQKMDSFMRPMEGGQGMVMFWVSDVVERNGGVVLPGDLEDREEERDLTLEELRKVLGKKVLVEGEEE